MSYITIVAIGGEPATGKSTLMRAVLKHFGPGEEVEWRKLKMTAFEKERFLVLGVYPPGETFGGTDRLSMSVQPDAVQFLDGLAHSPDWTDWWVLFEGDRLFNQSFLDFCYTLDPRGRFLFLRAAPAVLQERHAVRDQQNATWLKGRETKVHRLEHRYPNGLSLFHETPGQTRALAFAIANRDLGVLDSMRIP